MDLGAFFDRELAEHARTLALTGPAVRQPFLSLCQVCLDALKRGGKILFLGNGGSAADAQHLAAELVCRYKVNRRALPAMALSTDSSILTATANDFSYDQVFARQVEALARQEDVVIGISTSGRSASVLAALDAARNLGAVAAGLSGGDGGAMVGRAEPLIIVPSQVTARIQEMHILIGHLLCDVLESAFV